MSGKKARARKQKRERRDANAANAANAGEANPGLLNDIVVTHVLRSEYFDDPADLARLPAVSRAMRDAVAATGLTFEELDEDDAVDLGCLSAVQRLQRGGRLSRQEYLCEAAARSGQLEELKVLRADDTPWDRSTCWAAARGGHLEVLQWARANGFPWDAWTCLGAAGGGHLQVLQWTRANGCPWKPPRNEKAMIIAAQEGQETVVRALLEAGADVNKTLDKGATPLYIAAQNGLEAVVRALMEAGADVNKAMDNGGTPLNVAAQNGHAAIVRALIDLGADFNNATDNGGTPPLKRATMRSFRFSGMPARRDE
jgi:hypothetical protein